MISDQASGLRKMKNNQVKVIAITGGKGGVGKTNVTLNMAVSLGAAWKTCINTRCRFRAC